jgi:kynurenine formamidase
MLEGGEPGASGSGDATEITPHGYAVTHLDAFGHAYFEGRAFNGRRVGDVWTAEGLTYGAIDELRDGIFTRGVLLDVARARGVDWLEAGEGVSAADLDRAEALTGVHVGTGDAVIVRVGLEARELVQGEEDTAHRAGLLPDCVPWLHEREVAVFGGDCIEQLPSPYPQVPSPFHQVALVAMGLVLLDNPAVEELARVTRQLGRSAFLLTCAPLPIPGGTGSAVNPLAVF